MGRSTQETDAQAEALKARSEREMPANCGLVTAGAEMEISIGVRIPRQRGVAMFARGRAAKLIGHLTETRTQNSVIRSHHSSLIAFLDLI